VRTQLSKALQGTPDGEAADAIIGKCVHCGLCNATCPTYRLLGDELDGPRGRIYLVKQALEGAAVTRTTQLHLDRCLGCLNCETTCPSGVEYGRLLDIGRRLVDAKVARPWRERLLRRLLAQGLPSRWFASAAALGRALRPLLPQSLRDRLPVRPAARPRPAARRQAASRRVLLLAGCVQPALLPNIDRATQGVLAAAGIDAEYAAGAGCCGALRKHLNDGDGALADMRRNIDAWWPPLAAGAVDAIVVNASGCAVTVKDYAHALAGDPAYAAKAAAVSAAARDLSELLPELLPALRARLPAPPATTFAYHAPCTLQHGQRLAGGVETHLGALGFDIRPAPYDANLCCGSAGSYSLLQPGLAGELRDAKLRALGEIGANCILSANIGCILHLQAGTATPVRHWVEALEEALAPV